jgi:hypothetical protein
VVRLAGLAVVVQAVAPQLRDAQHGRHVLGSLVRAHDRRGLSFADHALQVADRREGPTELVLDEAGAPERVVEEGPEGVGPLVRDPQVVGERAGVVPEGLEMLGAQVSSERADPCAPEIFLERVCLVESRPGAALVRVRNEPANGNVGDAVLRVPSHELLELRPPRGVPAVDA